MAWVTISLRKLTLSARINNLEYRLMKLSQDKQSQQQSAAMAQSNLSMRKNNQYMGMQNSNSAFVTNVTNEMLNAQQAAQASGKTVDTATMQGFQNKIAQANNGLQMSKMMTDSLFQAEEDGLLQENNRKEAAIDQEMQMIETQLKAARAEEENLSKALDEDIKKSAINLM